MDLRSSSRDRKLIELAARQHGVVAFWQLAALGVTQTMVKRRLQTGRLYRLETEVYSLTPCASPRGRILAAALTYGPYAVLSHRAAAAVWDLSPWPTGVIDVTVPVRRRCRRQVRVHRAEVERVLKDGFPVTTVARTLVDLASVLPLGRLRDMFERAERLRLLDANEVSEQMHGRRGAKKIRAIVAEWAEPEPTKNEFEQSLRDLCRDYDIPLPSQNVVLLGYEVDAFWEPNLVVELDGWEWHNTRRAFEEDREKAAVLEANGYRVTRFTWRQMMRQRDTIAAAIKSGCPTTANRGRAPVRAAARRSSAPSA